MASEASYGRRRTNSSAMAEGRYGRARRLSRLPPQPKSSHTSDDFLQEFLSPSFDAATYLNSALPPLAAPRPGLTPTPQGAVPLEELSSQTQTLTTQLNTHTTRLADTLTQLTDDILRSGSRLAYEVELLRGETLSLTETLDETLEEDIKMFLPNGLQEPPPPPPKGTTMTGPRTDLAAEADAASGQQSLPGPDKKVAAAVAADDPDFIKQLETLTLVRSRLDSVVKVFGDAMDFVFPPSELSVSSSLLSVSAPEPGSAQQSTEDKGKQVLRGLRDEVSALLRDDAAEGRDRDRDPVRGIEAAARRIEELKALTRVWKGTAEEKGRNRFIESLAKMVEDRHRELVREMEQASRRSEGGRPRKSSVARDAAGQAGAAAGGQTEDAKSGLAGFGLINQLQKLRSGL